MTPENQQNQALDSPTSRPTMRLRIFAYHISTICNGEDLCSRSLGTTLHPCAGVSAHITVEKKSNEYGSFYDYHINGKWCGTAPGAIEEFCRLVCEKNPTIIFD